MNLTCTDGVTFTLQALSPERDSMRFCAPCPTFSPALRWVPLEPGAERVTYLRIDLNYLFPQRAFPDVQPCGRYFNRTLGAYRLQIGSVKVAQRPNGVRVNAPASNQVTIYRKQ